MEDLELITKAELARLVRKPKSWVDRAVSARQIPFTKLGREIRFSRADVLAIHAAGRESVMNP